MRTFVTYLYDLGRDYELHEQIVRLCVASFERNLDADQFVTITGAYLEGQGSGKALRNLRYSKMLVDLFGKVRALWEEGYDVLLADGDTLCLRPTPWPAGEGMRLFNTACCRVPRNAYPRHVFLHSGVKLFAQTMDPALWDIGQEMFDTYDPATWAYDQLIWNTMFWAQGNKRFSHAHGYADPRYCWCTPKQYDNLGVPREKAYIVHYCSTRGVRKCLQRMQRNAG